MPQAVTMSKVPCELIGLVSTSSTAQAWQLHLQLFQLQLQMRHTRWAWKSVKTRMRVNRDFSTSTHDLYIQFHCDWFWLTSWVSFYHSLGHSVAKEKKKKGEKREKKNSFEGVKKKSVLNCSKVKTTCPTSQFTPQKYCFQNWEYKIKKNKKRKWKF